MGKKKYTCYAVRKGRKPGIYKTWKECESQVKGFSGAEYKGYYSDKEAHEYMNGKKATLDKPIKKAIGGAPATATVAKATVEGAPFKTAQLSKEVIQSSKKNSNNLISATSKNSTIELKQQLEKGNPKVSFEQIQLLGDLRAQCNTVQNTIDALCKCFKENEHMPLILNIESQVSILKYSIADLLKKRGIS